MYHPSRGGVRGGTDQFSWDTVKSDKHRENYLGHSVMAPVGRWQKGKDLSWYAKERKTDDAATSKFNELSAIQKAEEEAMMVALGFKVAKKEEQFIPQEEMNEILKRGQDSERDSLNVERIGGVGIESKRSSMFMDNRRKNEGISFESHATSSLNVKRDPVSEKSTLREVTSQPPKKKHKKEKKQKKQKKKKKKKKYSSDLGSSDSEDIPKKKSDESRIIKNSKQIDYKDRIVDKKYRDSTHSLDRGQYSRKRQRHDTLESEDNELFKKKQNKNANKKTVHKSKEKNRYSSSDEFCKSYQDTKHGDNRTKGNYEASSSRRRHERHDTSDSD